jgi:hypothetical protein
MKFAFRGIFSVAMLCAVVIALAPSVSAQLPPPGFIFQLDTVHPGVLSTYTQFTTSFVGDGNTEFVSFAFREVPAFFAFDDAVVSTGGGPNLLADPGFESASFGQNCNHNNALGCPPGWSAWIQPVDVSAIGQVAVNGNTYGCNVNAHSGTAFWCDGSVEGYDAIYQGIATTLGATYNISFWLQDDSGAVMNNPNIDMFVYAGDHIPVGTVNIGTPEPATLTLIGGGLLALGLISRRRKTVK